MTYAAESYAQKTMISLEVRNETVGTVLETVSYTHLDVYKRQCVPNKTIANTAAILEASIHTPRNEKGFLSRLFSTATGSVRHNAMSCNLRCAIYSRMFSGFSCIHSVTRCFSASVEMCIRDR